MPNWEYKVISSGALGFASLALLEQHLNQLGKEEWEIIHFQTRPDNPLAFQGIARRPVMRDWVVEAPAAAAPKHGTVPAPPEERSEEVLSPAELKAEAEERRESLLAREESLRPVASAAADEPGDEDDDDDGEEFDDEENDEDLPTFFEAIRPHMRRNQRGPGMAVGVEYLAKKFEQSETDLVEALKECGFALPSSAKDQPTYLEYDGDLYWLNLNHRGQLWINTREKPRAVFKPAVGKPLSQEAAADAGLARGRGRERGSPGGDDRRENVEAPSAEVAPSSEPGAPSAEPQTPNPNPQTPNPDGVLQTGPALLDQLRPMMRRSRRGPGLSGSFSYLARALKVDAVRAGKRLCLARPRAAGEAGGQAGRSWRSDRLRIGLTATRRARSGSTRGRDGTRRPSRRRAPAPASRLPGRPRKLLVRPLSWPNPRRAECQAPAPSRRPKPGPKPQTPRPKRQMPRPRLQARRCRPLTPPGRS